MSRPVLSFVLRVTIILFIILLVGCSLGPAHFEGYILDINDESDRILVVSGLNKEEVLKIDKVDFDTLKRLDDAYWLRSKNISKFKKGDYVQVWFEGDIATSFPAQGTAKKISLAEEK